MSTPMPHEPDPRSRCAGSAGGAAAFIMQIFPFLLIFVIFYVLMIRPQQRRVKDHQATIAAVKKGDEVITAGGIRGRVTKVDRRRSRGRDRAGRQGPGRQVDPEPGR